MDETTSVRDLKKELRELKERRRKRIERPFPRAFIAEIVAAFVSFYSGVCFLLSPSLFDLPYYSEFKNYPFSGNQIGVFFVVLGFCTIAACLSRNSLARTLALAVQTFAWVFTTNATFHAVPYAPANSLLLVLIFIVSSAFIQVSLRLSPKSNWREEQEGNW